MPTGQQVINTALTAISILEQGGAPSVSDSNDALAELNDMWDAWGVDEGVIYSQIHERYPIAPGVGIYTIGPVSPLGAVPNFIAPQIPGKIYSANFVQVTGGGIFSTTLADGGTGYAANDTGVVLGSSGVLATYTVNTVTAGAVATYTISTAGTGYLNSSGESTRSTTGVGKGFEINITSVTATGQNRRNLTLANATVYHGAADLSASAYVPNLLYPEYNVNADGLARLYLWPIPSAISSGSLELVMGVHFAQWTLTGNYNVPPAYADAIKYVLAARLLPRFGVAVQPAVAQLIIQYAQQSELRIRQMNKFNRQMEPGTEIMTPSDVTPQAAAQ